MRGETIKPRNLKRQNIRKLQKKKVSTYQRVFACFWRLDSDTHAALCRRQLYRHVQKGPSFNSPSHNSFMVRCVQKGSLWRKKKKKNNNNIGRKGGGGGGKNEIQGGARLMCKGAPPTFLIFWKTTFRKWMKLVWILGEID